MNEEIIKSERKAADLVPGMRIGVIGAGRIVRLFLSAVAQVEGAVCTAICTREKTMERATLLGKQHEIEQIYNDVDKFLSDGDFDWVYIGVQNALHYEYAKKALLCNKHVIVEKPICGIRSQVEDLYQLAKERDRFMYEAMMVFYLPLYQTLKQCVERLVDIKVVMCNFSKVSSAYEAYCNGVVGHFFDKESYGGALYDLNIYNINVLAGIFGMPADVKYFPNHGYNGVDTSGVAMLTYPKYQVCCVAAKDSDGVDFMQIQARNGYIYLEGAAASLSKLTVCVDGVVETYEAQDEHDVRMACEVRAMKEMWAAGDLEACYAIMQDTLNAIEIIEKLHQSVECQADCRGILEL